MSNPVLLVPGVDSFERAEFDAQQVVDPKTAASGNPKLTFRTNTGQALTFELGAKSEFYADLAAWATAVSEALKAVGK